MCLVLMVVLSVDLMLGVFSRYVLVRTFTWYDEIARGCFVWVVFLGAAVGVRRGAHLPPHLFVGRLPPRLHPAVLAAGPPAVVPLSPLLLAPGLALLHPGPGHHTPPQRLPQ